VSRFSHITRCLDLQERDLSDALGARETTKELLAHLAAISAPNTGAAKTLIVLSHMATTACSWIDGDLSIELVADGESTVVEVATDLGGGLRERVLSPMTFRVPIQEFARAIERLPHVIAPLVIRSRSPRRVSLSATEVLRRTTAPPPPIQIASDSLFALTPPAAAKDASAGPGASVPPEDVDSGWDD
jgi:hypothetical protein